MPSKISASGPTKTSSPSIRYGAKRSNGASETLRPARFGRALAQREQHLDRDGVAARTLELVDVEGGRSAGGRGGREVVEQRPLVELEVRRADHGDRVDSGGGGVLDERQRVGGGLRPAMRRDLESARRGLDEELERTPPLGRVEEQPFSRRSEGKDAVEPGPDEEVDVRPEGVLVELCPRRAA